MKRHRAVQGDCWDYLSWKLYHDEGLAHILLKANPGLRRIVQFEAPAEINVPDKPRRQAQLQAGLPPWKRG